MTSGTTSAKANMKAPPDKSVPVADELSRNADGLVVGAGELVCGVDEAGRGPLAGPVVAAAVILGPEVVEGLDDSKRLSASRREALAEVIREECICWSLGAGAVDEIDRFNIRRATMFAMQRAVEGIVICPDLVLVDGDFVPDLPYPARAIVGGDGKVPEIMAASILAKVARDRMMRELDEQHPGYNFARHKGYGTADHLRALQKFGPSPHHRKTFAPVRAAEK